MSERDYRAANSNYYNDLMLGRDKLITEIDLDKARKEVEDHVRKITSTHKFLPALRVGDRTYRILGPAVITAFISDHFSTVRHFINISSLERNYKAPFENEIRRQNRIMLQNHFRKLVEEYLVVENIVASEAYHGGGYVNFDDLYLGISSDALQYYIRYFTYFVDDFSESHYLLSPELHSAYPGFWTFLNVIGSNHARLHEEMRSLRHNYLKLER